MNLVWFWFGSSLGRTRGYTEENFRTPHQRAPTDRLAIPGRSRKFNLVSSLRVRCPEVSAPQAALKALTLQNPPSIRAAMAAGAIPPPRFFEHCRPDAQIASCHRSSRTFRITSSVDLVREHDCLAQGSGRRAHPRLKSEPSARGILRRWPIRLPPRKRRARSPAAP